MSANQKSDREALGERLRIAREYMDLAQEEVAKALGISRTAVSLFESGQRKVDALELKRLADLYQRPVAWFTGGELDQGDSKITDEVQHLARAAAELSVEDQSELLQFAKFLESRPKQKK